MRTPKLLKKTVLLSITLMMMLPLVNAQSRYRHLPRVKVEITKVKQIEPLKEKATISMSNTVEIISTETEPNTPTTLLNDENTTVASSNNEVILADKKLSLVISHSILKKDQADNKQLFTPKVKKESKILAVSEVKKTAGLLGYLLWFFIVLLICIALFVLAIFFFSTLFAIYPIFLTLAIVVLAIAVLILIFGLTGLI